MVTQWPLTVEEVRRIVFFLNQRTDDREALRLAEKINITMGESARREEDVHEVQ